MTESTYGASSACESPGHCYSGRREEDEHLKKRKRRRGCLQTFVRDTEERRAGLCLSAGKRLGGADAQYIGKSTGDVTVGALALPSEGSAWP